MKRLYVVGIGPGGYEGMTMEAVRVLEDCDVIVGYTGYVELVREAFPQWEGKRFLTTGMKQERERCRMALELAETKERVAMVCSGDASVYGMAGLLMELADGEDGFPEVEICAVAGVTAALSGGAVLGAPLGHDFAVISLSDLMTPWAQIEKRLEAAALADFVICLYNPASRMRRDHLQRACLAVGKYRSPDTVCGYVKNIGRKGEEKGILTLSELQNLEADMFTTVFIGNSQTSRIRDWMVTPRGYRME